MITYEPFWETLRSSGETTYSLISKYNISSATINRLRQGQAVNTTTINDLCRILNCDITGIVRYRPSERDQKL